jgi:hypothetical protein
MPSIGVSCVRGRILHDDCRECVKNPLHPCAYPADLLELMRDVDNDVPPSAHTPSRMAGCARQAVLEETTDYYVDVDYAYPMARGNMVHALMEHAKYPDAYNTIRERRFTTELDTVSGRKSFSGKPDLIVVKSIDNIFGAKPTAHVKVVDYKSKKEIGHDLTAASIEHQIQVNLYAWLVTRELGFFLSFSSHVDIVVDELEIVYADMKKVRRFTTAGELYANGKMIRRSPRQYETLTLEPIKMKSLDWCEGYVKRNIERREAAKDRLPAVLPEEESWKCMRCPVFEACDRRAQENNERRPAA